MKYLLLLLLSFNSFAYTKFVMTDLRNNSTQGEGVFETEELAIKELVKISKIKNGWRKGVFNNIVEGSLYCNEGLEGETPSCYHPTNWSYVLTDVTAEVDAKNKKKDKDESDLAAIRTKVQDGSAKLDDLINYIKIKEGF